MPETDLDDLTPEDKAAKELQERRAEFVHAQETEDWRSILSVPQGRAVIWRLLSECGVYSDNFRGEETHAMARETGKRFIGLSILEKVFTSDGNAYMIMRNEAVDRAKALEKVK